MSLNDYYRITVVWLNNDTGERNTIGLAAKQTSVALASMADLQTEFTAWWNSIKSFFPNDLQYVELTRRRIKPLEPIEESDTTGLPIAGTGGTDALDPSTAAVVSLRTNNIGRSYRGRVYLPAFEQGQLTVDGNFNTTSAGTVKTAFETLQSDLGSMGSGSMGLSVFSKVLDTGTDVTEFLVDSRLRVQRRRTVRQPAYV